MTGYQSFAADTAYQLVKRYIDDMYKLNKQYQMTTTQAALAAEHDRALGFLKALRDIAKAAGDTQPGSPGSPG